MENILHDDSDNTDEKTRSIKTLNYMNNFEKDLDELISQDKIRKSRENNNWYKYNKYPKNLKIKK
jgi:hypothetical protein